MADRVDRKAVLEKKKAKLAQIRAEKQKKLPRKEDEKVSVTVSSSLDQKRRDAENLLMSVGIDYTTTVVPAATAIEQPTQSKKMGQPESLAESAVYRPRQTKLKSLENSKVWVTSIPPKEVVSYTKETQTIVQQQDSEDEFEELEQAAKDEALAESRKVAEAGDTDEEETKQELDQVTRELSEEEKHVIENSDGFQSFFLRSSKFIERALHHPIDIFTEYDTQVEESSEIDKSMKLTMNRVFSDERWSKRRMVTSLDWSTHHPELSMAAYGNSEEAVYDPEGVVLVWNSKYKTTVPEHRFHCQSSVTASCFAKFHPNLVIGGTYSGQIVVWDNRSSRRTAQRSKLSTAAHTHPVYCIDIVGSQNAHNLMSISNDGKVCSWSLDMLSQPLEAFEMQHKQAKSVAVMCMSFQHNNVNNFAVGSEDGSVYTACRHGSKTGISEHFEGHKGPVSGIDFNKSTSQMDFSHVLLTSSLDWTIKLWSIKDSQKTCLHSFEDRNDCVYDVAWSPVHPSLFASADCGGNLDVWNINTDVEEPIVSATLPSQFSANKLRWNGNGTQIAVGDSVGGVYLYDVGEQIASPRPDDWNRFVRSMNEIRNMHQEEK